jgi:hypothetical protein
LENGDAGAPAQAVQAVPAPVSSTGQASPPSLLARIGRGLKSLVTRSPSKQH